MFDAPLTVEVTRDGPPRQRREPDYDAPRYVRRVKGRAYQSRVWVGLHNGRSLNLGLFTVSEHETWELARWAAARASREFVKRYRGDNLTETLDELKRLRFIPQHVLPTYVRRTDRGTYTAACYRGKAPHRIRIALPSEHATAAEAHAAFVAHLERELLAGRLEATAPQVELLRRLFARKYRVRTAARAAGVSEQTARRVREAARRALTACRPAPQCAPVHT